MSASITLVYSHYSCVLCIMHKVEWKNKNKSIKMTIRSMTCIIHSKLSKKKDVIAQQFYYRVNCMY